MDVDAILGVSRVTTLLFDMNLIVSTFPSITEGHETWVGLKVQVFFGKFSVISYLS